MIGDKRIEGTAENSADGIAETTGCRTELILKVPSYAADEGYRQVWTAIGANAVSEEVAEVLLNELLEPDVFNMTTDKL